MEYTDEELARLAKDNKEYLEALILRYRVFVLRLTYSYELPTYNSEDFLQEGLIALCNAVKSYDNNKNTKFSTYATACIRNHIKDIFKAAGRDKRKAPTISLDAQINNEEKGDYHSLMAADTPSPEEKVLAEESRLEQEEKLKEQLSSLEYNVIMLRIEGLSYEEIAKDLNKREKKKITPKMVDNALQRAKLKLEGWRADT